MPDRIPINAGDFSALSGLNLSDQTINALRRAHAGGLRFRDARDLSLLDIPRQDLDALADLIDFRPVPPLLRLLRIEVGPPPLTGYQVRLESGGFLRHALLSNSGAATLAYRQQDLADVLRLTVLAPGGQRVDIDADGGNTFPFHEVNTRNLNDIRLTVRKTPVLPQAKPAIPATSPIRGRVVSTNVRKNYEDISVTIFATTTPNPTAKDFFIVATAQTESNGFFSTGQLLFPNSGDSTALTAAMAVIGVHPVQDHPITLTAAPDGGAQLPQRLLLFVDEARLAEASGAASDCGCSTLNFHQKKPLDEFSFHTVIRTTEPLIEAYTLTPVEEVDLADVLPGAPAGTRIRVDVLRNAIDRFGSITNANLNDLLTTDLQARLRDRLFAPPKSPPGRTLLDGDAAVDWDDNPTIYQATSIAHGHLLHFKQEWQADGYSLGDLLYSLPLAPGQQKQIVVFDWDRKESASNTQSIDYQESLYNSLSRDRDVNEVASSMLRDSVRASSEVETSTTTWGLGGGALGVIPAQMPIPVGVLAGVSGGNGSGSSTAVQDGSRTATASASQTIQDRTVQAASAVRSQRSTVIQTVSQGERFQVSSESIANYNHCHALTIQYFEVLRHFMVRTRLADVQECLFVPLKLSPFDRRKALRWRDALARFLKKRALLPGFAALERVEEEASSSQNHYDAIGFPRASFAAEPITYLEGEMQVEFHITRPSDNDKDDYLDTEWSHLAPVLGSTSEFYSTYIRSESKKDAAFARHAGPRIAAAVLDALQLDARSQQAGVNRRLPLDFTLMSNFVPGAPMSISLRFNGDPGIRRDAVDLVRLQVPQNRRTNRFRTLLSKTVRLRVRSLSLRYRTAHSAEHLLRNVRIDNDLTLDGDDVWVPTPLQPSELRQPRLEDVERANALLRHLNENIEYYHQCIWLQMDPQRRFMLLDGIIAPGRAAGRSVACVVENRLVGIAGNSLILPVAPGFRLDPNLKEDVDLYTHYYEDPRDPVRLSLPTKGVFAEAVMGACNSCEKINEDRFWRWGDEPIPLTPSAISPAPVPAPDRAAADPAPAPLPSPIINLQNAPPLPESTGLRDLISLLGRADSFRDLTGLTANQQNALDALRRSFDSTTRFGELAADLTRAAAGTISPNVKDLADAKKHNLIDDDEARRIFTDQAGKAGSTAREVIREIEVVSDAVNEKRITQQQATEILTLLRELREKELRSTLDKSSVTEITRESSRFEHETPRGEKTIITRNPQPRPRDIQVALFVKDQYGNSFSSATLPGTSVLITITAPAMTASFTLDSSGTHFGTVMPGARPDGGVLEVLVLDENFAPDNIVFSGEAALSIAPDARLIHVTATMAARRQSITTVNGSTHEEQIARKIDIALGGKLSANFKVPLSKVIELSAGGERTGSIGGGISDSTTDGTSSSETIAFDALIPTGRLDVSIR